MTDKPKIHIFLGAPHPSSLSKDVQEEEEKEGGLPFQWKTLELRWSQGRLRHLECKGDATPEVSEGGLSTGDCVEAIGRLKPKRVHEKQSFSGTHEGSKTGNVSEDDSTCSTGLSCSAIGTNSAAAAPMVEGNSPTDLGNSICLGSSEDDKTKDSEGESVEEPEDNLTPPVSRSALERQAYTEKELEKDFCPGIVAEYLDSCFLSLQPGPSSNPMIRHPEQSPAISVETEYLTVWTKSQSLLLRGRVVKQPQGGSQEKPRSPQTPTQQTPVASVGSPELYSPEVSPVQRGLGGTLQSSLSIFYESLSQRHHEGGVVIECTPDGILCSQASPPVDQEGANQSAESPISSVTPEISPTPSTSKRAKLSPSTSKGHRQMGSKSVLPLCGPTTLLSRCKSHGVHYSILVAVVHPCHLKEIKVKSGASAGASVPLASMIVTDQSGVEVKAVLWRTAAFWALTVSPGDILLITGVRVHEDKWRGETVLQSSFNSRLLNLGQITPDHTSQAPQNVNIHTWRTLCTYLHEKRPLLVSLPARTAQDPHSVSFVRLGSLRPDTLVHALLRVKHSKTISAWRDEVEGVSRTGSVLRAVLSVEQGDGTQGAVVLWGSALALLQRINRNTDAVWEFRLLLVKQDVTSGLLELHSTPWSSCHPVFPDDTRCKEFYNTASSHNSFEIDLHTLLSQKYTGNVELKAQITAVQFQSSPSQDAVQLMDREMSLEKVLEVVCGDITFTGCGLCCAELDTDENGIYRPCYPCLPHTGVRRYYRPAVLTVREGDRQVCVQVPPTLLQKILLDTPPDKLNKPVAPASEERFVHVVAKRIHSILSTPRTLYCLTVRSHFECDENSVPIIQNFFLLEFKS
ncbi:shieldin complex subunit 2 isoform X1 [Astyanax mexicanus]|uniref:shieldin complex subunit 2 isoform X1 n=1 Tax=Astyanax mexicanus TaxID=7994 RepID=UPI0020CB0B12|nr:shieldin complex subunit 2 isoform X1 [Astyanax mexicanus]